MAWLDWSMLLLVKVGGVLWLAGAVKRTATEAFTWPIHPPLRRAPVNRAERRQAERGLR